MPSDSSEPFILGGPPFHGAAPLEPAFGGAIAKSEGEERTRILKSDSGSDFGAIPARVCSRNAINRPY